MLYLEKKQLITA